MIQWADHHEKGRVAEVLVMEAMSSEDSCYEDDENGNAKVANYAVKKLPWESRAMRKVKKKWIKHTGRGYPKGQSKGLWAGLRQRNHQHASLQMIFLNGP